MFSWFAMFIQRLFKVFRVCTRTSGLGSARKPAMMGIPSNSRMRFWNSHEHFLKNKIIKLWFGGDQKIHQFARIHDRQTWFTVKAAAFPSVSRIWHLSDGVVLVWRHDSNIFRCLGSSVPADPWMIFSKTHKTNKLLAIWDKQCEYLDIFRLTIVFYCWGYFVESSRYILTFVRIF